APAGSPCPSGSTRCRRTSAAQPSPTSPRRRSTYTPFSTSSDLRRASLAAEVDRTRAYRTSHECPHTPRSRGRPGLSPLPPHAEELEHAPRVPQEGLPHLRGIEVRHPFDRFAIAKQEPIDVVPGHLVSADRRVERELHEEHVPGCAPAVDLGAQIRQGAK